MACVPCLKATSPCNVSDIPLVEPSHPHCCLQVGVSEGRLRKWLMSVTAFLRNHNGTVGEAIDLWRRNAQKEFEGVMGQLSGQDVHRLASTPGPNCNVSSQAWRSASSVTASFTPPTGACQSCRAGHAPRNSMLRACISGFARAGSPTAPTASRPGRCVDASLSSSSQQSGRKGGGIVV